MEVKKYTMPIGRRLVFACLALSLPLAHADDESLGIYGVYSEAALGGSVTIARGSNMLIFSGDFPVGPSAPRKADGFPLVTSLAGTSVRVMVGAAAVDAYVLGAETQFVRALLPSPTPLGDGTLVVTYNGQSSVPYRIRVVERQFAIYDGSWCGPSSLPKQPSFCVPRTVQNANSAGEISANSLLAPARPGQLVTLAGTGLGAAPGDEAAELIPGHLQIPGLQVLVGNRPAKIVYSGRSDCCAGTDQITFEVPPGIEGCNVPVWVRFGEDGSATGDVFVSIASGTGACSDPQGLSETEVRKLSAGNLSAAQVSITQGYWSAAFGTASRTTVTPFGTCRAYSWGGAFTVDLALDSLRDAGRTLSLHTPHRTLTATRADNGFYNGPFEGQPEPGDYSFDNSGGNLAAQPFRAQFSIPETKFTWTNRDEFTNRTLSKGVTVSWSGADASEGYTASLVGTLANDGEISSGFICSERADKGTLTIPPSVLERAGVGHADFNELSVLLSFRFSQRISIAGVDFAEFVFFSPGEVKTVNLR